MKHTIGTIITGTITVVVNYIADINEYLTLLISIGTLMLVVFKIADWIKSYKKNKKK